MAQSVIRCIPIALPNSLSLRWPHEANAELTWFQGAGVIGQGRNPPSPSVTSLFRLEIRVAVSGSGRSPPRATKPRLQNELVVETPEFLCMSPAALELVIDSMCAVPREAAEEAVPLGSRGWSGPHATRNPREDDPCRMGQRAGLELGCAGRLTLW